jgi:saccharopine dehydrogenase-like NADP-dependent oxidoreductase
MNVLLLGTGMQGRAALHDLVHSPGVSRVVAADRDLASLEAWVSSRGYGDRVECRAVDAADAASLDRLLQADVDVAIDLLPVPFIGLVAAAAVRAGVHLVNTFYTTPELRALAPEAERRGVTLLPEMGLDPGIDLVLLGDLAREFDEITAIRSYGAGIPEPAAANTPIKYKVSWTLEGVLRSYRRAARVVRDGRIVEIGDTEQFRPHHLHVVDLPDIGPLEAFPNGDAIEYIRMLGLDPARLRDAGRYALRYPGHSAFWQTLVDLHLLDDDVTVVEGVAVNRRKFLAAALAPYLQYADDERDLAIVRVEIEGRSGGRPCRAMRQVIDRRDLGTGLTAMSRTVGFPASIGAQLVATGVVRKRGLLSPVTDVPCEPFVDALAARGIAVTSERW